MTTKAQERFLKWAKAKKGRWPETNSGKYRIPVLDLAIQEFIADYLKSKDISPLRQFLETSATFLLPTDVEKLKPPSVTNTSFSPTELARAKMVYALCEVYGFMGDFETAWQVCVQSGLDSEEEKYLFFGVHSKQRKFTARQAYYFPGFRPPILIPTCLSTSSMSLFQFGMPLPQLTPAPRNKTNPSFLYCSNNRSRTLSGR
jgi:hypothetical protein